MPLVDDATVREFGVGFANEQLGWVGTTQGGFETHDGGAHWASVDLGRNVNKIRILPNGQGSFTAYAIGADVFRFGQAPTVTPPSQADNRTPTVGKP
jgi:hypothetical protein